VQVSVNPATGAVTSFSSQDVAVTIPTRPSITADQAKAVAVATAHLVGNVMIDSNNLTVLLRSNGAQHLAWVVTLSVVHDANYVGLAPGLHVIEVDALTGAATEVAR
jgi:hypothetical protein